MSKPFDIFSFVPDHFKTDTGTLLRAILDALSSNHDKLTKAIEGAIDQQFLSTASGKYLLYLGEQQGFVLPPNSGLDIRSLRALVPIAVANPKQVSATLIGLIEAFYGSDKVRTTAIAQVAEPYSFVDGDDLTIQTESGSASVGFVSALFSDITNVSAAELATLINTSQNLFVADSYLDRKTNKKFLRVSSKTIGVGSSVQVVGGTAQNVLKLPKVVGTANATGTSWTVTKVATYSDLTTVQWTGAGINPKLYLVKAGDTVSIRGLVGNVVGLNGSYVVQDCGYDYFTILNVPYQNITDAFSQPADNSIVFTSQLKNGIYDLTEYAISTETSDDTVRIRVPAVPPIARRFLAGSSHLHGAELSVLDFTRSSLTVDTSLIDMAPSDVNSFVLESDHQRYDFDKGTVYKTAGSDKGSPRTYVADTSDPTFNTLPFTNVQPIGTNSIYAQPGSTDYYITFPFPHGLRYRWGFTLGVTSGSANLSMATLNQQQIVGSVVDPYTIRFQINDASGVPIPYQGVAVSGFTVNQFTVAQSDGSDFYLDFGTSAALLASGLASGQTFKVDPNGGTNVSAYYGLMLRNKPFQVITVSGSRATIRTGYGTGSAGTVMTGASGVRTGAFGGNVSYFFDKTTSWNQTYVLAGLKALFREFTPSSNPAYVGSYIYDPTGQQYQNTVSSHILTNAQQILKGSNPVAVFVNDVSAFPPSGSFIIDYGTDLAEGPITFLSTIQNGSGNSQVLIDPSYKFKFSHDPGALLWAVSATTPFSPDTTGKHYPAYLTGTAKARDTLLEILKLLAASGIFIDFKALLPDLKFADPSISPYE